MDLSQAFNNRSKQIHIDLSLQDKAEDVGLIRLNNAPNEGKHEIVEKKKKYELTDRLMRVLAQTRHQLQDFSDRMDMAAIKANKELQNYKDLRADRKTLTKCVDELNDGGVLARNANGELVDRNLKTALDRYAKTSNRSNDFNDDSYVLALASNALATYPTDVQLEQLENLQSKIVEKIDEGRNSATIWYKDLDNAETTSEEEALKVVNDINSEMTKFDDKLNSLEQQKTAVLQAPAQQAAIPISNKLSF